ncbi:hypothetical protein HH308_26405 [Gordonia sp. TBRC 11910]|uniref:Transmembrane protein n=1 Tax=Gordonia asplenii TaxID=2725283 RepID=A0A848L186_9ACTN|nr:hypothetical protein [Gordonia asplenii]NMO04760.1 hypothetical protein [Gordonia asplenii]
MSISRDVPDDAAQAAADALDAEIAAMRDGESADPQLRWLSNAMSVDPPSNLYRRIERGIGVRRARWWRAAQVAAVLLGLLICWQGVSILILGQWISRHLGEPYGEHMAFEGALAFIAVGIAVLASATRRRWLPLGIVAGVPLGLALGAHGVPEATEFAWGAVLHFSEGIAAIVVLVTFGVAWRYSRVEGAEDDM